MHRQGFDLQLTQYDERGWRATFYTTGMEHSPTSATGTGKGAHALGTRLTRSAASLARWARVARIGEKYAPGWAWWSAVGASARIESNVFTCSHL
jgi:hypothetical protein